MSGLIGRRAGGRKASTGRRTGPLVRSGLDWNLWLGVAPTRPYHPAYCPFVWRGWKDFGTGAVGDMGIHNTAMPFAALDLGPPSAAEIVATSGLKPETFPAWSRLKLEFPARGGRGPITMYWYDGGQKPSADLVGGRKLADNGAIVVGTKGTLSSVEWTGGDWALLPEDRFRDFKPPHSSLPRAPEQSHHQEWLRRLPGRSPGFLPLRRLRGPVDRDHACRQSRPANRQESPLGCRDNDGNRLPRSRPVHQARLPQGMVRNNLEASRRPGRFRLWPAR